MISFLTRYRYHLSLIHILPMVVPEINPQHMEVIKYQKERLGTKRGFVAVKPNCSIQSYAPVLTAWKEFEPYEVVATTYQAISGAGKTFKDWPEMLGNIIPYIGGEEEKSEKEPLRIWGQDVYKRQNEKYYKHRLEYDTEYEVIGNTFDNPELLESEG